MERKYMRNLGFGILRLAVVVIAALRLSMGLGWADETLPAIELKVAYPGLKFARPLWLEEAPDGSKRVFVVEQTGKILLMPRERDGKEAGVFLDISSRQPKVDDEEGLLGMAFHPQFKTNHKFYVFYSQQNPKRSVISEFQVSASHPGEADLSSERILMEIPRPYWNHDGGTMIFGPDGYLYISVGDGGLGADPHNFGQSLNFLQAKILRIDVNSHEDRLQYGIPRDNPFAGGKVTDGWRRETWAYGLRNAWRMSFDRETGELWAADVGQDKWEEVDLIVKGGNYGWSAREGFHSFKDKVVVTNAIDPIIEYAHTPALAKESKFPDHGVGMSITGGYVYRGSKMPKLRGVYVYGDYMVGTIWGLRHEGGKLTADGVLVKGNPIRHIASFGQDGDGELYVLAFDGNIYQVVEGKADADAAK